MYAHTHRTNSMHVYTCIHMYTYTVYTHTCIHTYMYDQQKVSSHVLLKRETFIEEDTRYKKHCTKDTDADWAFVSGS